MGERHTRRTVLELGGLGGLAGLAGCAGLLGGTPTEEDEEDDGDDDDRTLVDPPVDEPPFDDRLAFQVSDRRAPLSNPWFYKERFTDGDPIEGLERPVWICVFADNTDYTPTPTGDQPNRNFEIEDGAVEAKVGTEPTNDSYVALKRRSDHATLKFLEKQAGADHEFFFDDELLFRTEETEPGTEFRLPPE